MSDKERKQFKKDLYSPRFELTQTYKSISKAKSPKNIVNSRNDLFQLMKGKSTVIPQIQVLAQSYNSVNKPEIEKRTNDEIVKIQYYLF